MAADPGAAQALTGALQLAIGGAFATSVVPKLRDPRHFAATVAAYEILPRRLAPAGARLVIAAEAAVAVLLLSGLAFGGGVALALGLLALFAAATWTNLRRGRAIECGCFGGSGEVISPRSLARIAILAAAALALGAAVAGGAAEALRAPWEEPWAGAGHVAEVAAVAAAMAIATMWALEAPKLRDLARRPVHADPHDHFELHIEPGGPRG